MVDTPISIRLMGTNTDSIIVFTLFPGRSVSVVVMPVLGCVDSKMMLEVVSKMSVFVVLLLKEVMTSPVSVVMISNVVPTAALLVGVGFS